MSSRQFSNMLAKSMVAVLIVGGMAVAQPQPTAGSVSFSGATWYPKDAGGSPTDISGAVGINIGEPLFNVEAASGNFAGFAETSLDVAAPSLYLDPFQPLDTPWWTGGGFSFYLDDLSLEFRSNFQINLVGTGTLMADGYGDPPAIFTFTGDRAADVSSFCGVTATVEVVDVPEPSIIGLLGLGLLSLSLLVRRRRSV